MNRTMREFRRGLRAAGLVDEPWFEPAGTFAVGCVAGALAGAAVAMLFAPRAGADTRREIASKARSLVRRAKPMVSEARRELESAAEKATNAIGSSPSTAYPSHQAPIE